MKYLLFSFAFLFFACQSPTDYNDSDAVDIDAYEETTPSERISPGPLPESQIMSYGDYRVHIEREDNLIQINARTPNNQPLERVEIDMPGQIQQTELTDLNNDGRPEVVVIGRNEDGQEQLAVRSISSTSALPVYVDQGSLNAKPNSHHYEIRDGRIFDLYETTDGKRQQSSYNLVAGEAGFRLEPHGISLEELNNSVYGEYVSDPYPNTYRQRLMIRDNGLGEIVVKFSSGAGTNEKSDCELQGVGRLVNGEIRVPLSYFERSMGGALSLTSTNDGWEVMTVSPEQQTVINQLCPSGVGILGKYKRVME
jgi:hypothetical protein